VGEEGREGLLVPGCSVFVPMFPYYSIDGKGVVKRVVKGEGLGVLRVVQSFELCYTKDLTLRDITTLFVCLLLCRHTASPLIIAGTHTGGVQ